MYELEIYREVMCHDKIEWCKIWRGIKIVSSKSTWGTSQTLTRALKNLKNLHFNGLLLTYVYNVWAKESTEELYRMALKIDAKFEGKLIGPF